MRIIGTFIYLLIGYLLGAWLSSDQISTNLAETDWASLWVYAWMLLWPLMLMGMFIYYAVILAVVIFVGAWLHDKIKYG